MTEINLLNWREKRHIVENNRFFFLIGFTVVVCLLLVFMIDGIIQEIGASNQADVDFLTAQISALEPKISEIKDLQTQKDLLLARRQVIESLQNSRPFVVNIFDNLSRIVPPGVTLTQLERKGDVLTLTGIGNSNSDVADFLNNLQKMRWVNSAKLSDLKLSQQKGGGETKENKGSQSESRNTQASTTSSKVEFKIEVSLVSVEAPLEAATAKASGNEKVESTAPGATPGPKASSASHNASTPKTPPVKGDK